MLLHTQRHNPCAYTRGPGLSPEVDKLPTQSGNKDAKSERRAIVGIEERSEVGSDLGKRMMGASGMSFRDSSQTGIRGRGVRDQARNRELRG